jgi:acetyl esterase/lipase
MRAAPFITAILLMAGIAGCTPQPPEPIPPTNPGTLNDTTIVNIAYGGDAAQTMDLGLPANRTNATALVVVIHGGGWSTGDKNELSFMVTGLKQRGFAVANINYRLSPKTNDNYAMQLDDINTAIQFVFGKAPGYTFSTQKLYLVGHSAGAHLALSYAYTRNTNGKIKAVGSMAGPTNLFNAAYYNPFPGDWQTILTPFLNTPLFPITAASEARYKAASPFYQASASVPPTILFHGDADPRVYAEQSASLYTRLGVLGVDRKYILYSPLVFHDWWADIAKRDNTLDELKTWFTNHP